MIDILAIGELLVDFTPIESSEIKGFVENPGGAPCNMLTMAQNLGSRTAFIGQVGNDDFGKRLGKVLTAQGIETKGLIYSSEYPTTLAFVHLGNDGERSFSFYRKGCADVMLKSSDIDYSLVQNSRCVHFGSLSFTDEPSRSTVLKVLERARKEGSLITYDPNYRPLLWDSLESAVMGMKLGLEFADILKVSDEEAVLLTGHTDLELAARALLEYGIKLVCITLGPKGCYYIKNTNEGIVDGYVSGYDATAIDTTGAGDSFFGAVVSQVLNEDGSIESISKKAIEKILGKANCAASLCIESYGGIPAIPTQNMVEERYNKFT